MPASARAQSQQPLSGAERQRRYRQAHGRGTVDLAPETLGVLRRVRASLGGSTNQIIFKALVALEEQISGDPQAVERVMDAGGPCPAPRVDQELSRDVSGEGANASIQINNTPDRDPPAEAPLAIPPDADPVAAAPSASSAPRSKRVRSTEAARRTARASEDDKPKGTHGAKAGADTSLRSGPLPASRGPKNPPVMGQGALDLGGF